MDKGPIFTPERVQRAVTSAARRSNEAGDDRDGAIYVYHEDNIALAVNVAWATHRPLLLSGPSGCGKSTLAKNVALSLGWRYYEHVVTSRTEANDLLYKFDSIRRLNDAQARESLKPMAAYIEPQALWWAFDKASAKSRGSLKEFSIDLQAQDPCEENANADRAVVLIDEIDKADVDVPNNLLVPLGSLQFKVEPTGANVMAEKGNQPLIFITTNGERELPLTFLRRCVTLTLPAPGKRALLEIAEARMPQVEANLFGAIADYILEQAKQNDNEKTAVASTAEYLDTVQACWQLGIRPEDDYFKNLARITLRKNQNI